MTGNEAYMYLVEASSHLDVANRALAFANERRGGIVPAKPGSDVYRFTNPKANELANKSMSYIAKHSPSPV